MDGLFKTFISKPPTISIFIEPSGHEPTLLKNQRGEAVEYPTFYSKEPIRGRVQLDLNNNRNFKHSGIKIELIGMIENYRDRNLSSRFISLTNDLSPPGSILNEINYFDYEFSSIDKQFETYRGKLMGIKFILQVTIQIPYKPQTEETEIVILNPQRGDDFNRLNNSPLKVEIGIENLLHVCFELDKTNFHLKDVVTGKVWFKNLNLELQNMELQIVRKENSYNKEGENEVLGTYEIMEGTPSSTDDIIPIRMYLRGYKNLAPSLKNVNNKFSVDYSVNLELTDSEQRKFFKRMEICLTRLDESYYYEYRKAHEKDKFKSTVKREKSNFFGK